ncbi:hypothetical protein [Azospirillum rugosum]|uniref:Uncharacterized protein n=1 Tax=Azospirillum rugosum TaxID=416170 RepID=A0ABS4SVE3_9PROT|nr:hypothetical protein [Azospirillum rugosum]MBP2296531.1 hypothetical protein [Azospirillum rugosum]MDQ0530069.1 hypothetical protein [Azospirillum rugosum]
MAERNGGKGPERRGQAPDFGPVGGGEPVTPGRAGQGMGVSTGDYGEAPPEPARSAADGPATTVTVGEDTGQRRDLPDQDAAPPTPKAGAGKRPRRDAEEPQG